MPEIINEIWKAIARFAAMYGLNILGAIVILLIGSIVSRWAGRATQRYGERSERMGPTLTPLVAKIARLFVLAVTWIAALNKLGVDTTSLLAGMGALGLAVGLALKDTLSDMAAGIELLVLRPFEAGDKVDIEGTEGVIDGIDMFETKLTGFDGVPLVLPNKKVRSGRIRNYTRAKKRRVDIHISISHKADIDRALIVIKEFMKEDERVFDEPAPVVNVLRVAESSVDLIARVWVTPGEWFPTQLDLHRKMKLSLDGAGIAIPHPQRDVRILERAVA